MARTALRVDRGDMDAGRARRATRGRGGAVPPRGAHTAGCHAHGFAWACREGSMPTQSRGHGTRHQGSTTARRRLALALRVGLGVSAIACKATLVCLGLIVVAPSARGQQPLAVSADPHDWPTYNRDVLGTRHNPAEKSLGPDNVARLIEKW